MILAGCNRSKQSTTTFDSKSSNSSKTTVTTMPSEKKAPKIGTINNAIATDTKTDTKKITEVVKADPIAVTSFKEDKTTTKKAFNLIEGTTPEDTFKIKINDYTLSKYKAGETHWNYIASTSLGTLKKGINSYKIVALDGNGAEITSKTVTIDYQGANNGSLAKTGNNSLLSLIVAITASGALYFRRSLV